LIALLLEGDFPFAAYLEQGVETAAMGLEDVEQRVAHFSGAEGGDDAQVQADPSDAAADRGAADLGVKVVEAGDMG
jgi:hypothetical protein